MTKVQNEIWKDIPDYEGYYQVSNSGNVRGLERIDCKGQLRKARIMKQKSDKDGYKTITASKERISKTVKVHRLVALAFIPNPHNLPQVNHKNGIKDDNRLENLEWCSLQDNIKHSIITGLKKVAKGERCRHSKLTEKQVYDIFNAHGYQKDIAALFGVSKSTVYEIKRAKRWKHLNLKSNSQQLRYSA